MICADCQKFVSAFVDGELDAPTMRDFDRHLAGCTECRTLVDDERAVKRAVRSSLCRVTAPPHLRERIRVALDRADAAASRRRFVVVWLAPIAAAAGLAFWAFASFLGGPEAEGPSVFDRVTSLHARNLPVEVASADPNDVVGWFQGKVDFPVRPPRFGSRRGALVGARLSHVGERQAAQLVYDVDGRRVTVLVFEAENPPASGRTLRVRDRELRVGNAHGYTSAFLERGGLGYLFVSDFDQSEAVRLASQAVW